MITYEYRLSNAGVLYVREKTVNADGSVSNKRWALNPYSDLTGVPAAIQAECSLRFNADTTAAFNASIADAANQAEV